MSDAALVLYRAVACPYSHRVELVLAAKGLAADRVEIDLLDRPAAFMSRSSGGRIPLLEIDGTEVPFGDRVNEFLDERFPTPPLNGGTALQRARARQWVDWCTTVLGPTYEAALMNVDPDREAELLDKLEGILPLLEARLAEHAPSPYFHGAEPGWVDLTYATIAVRFAGLERFHGWTIPERFPHLRRWFAALTADPLVSANTDLDGIMSMLEYYRDVFIRARA